MPMRTDRHAERGALAYMLLDRLAAAAGENGATGGFVSIEGERAESYQLGLLDFLAALGIVEQSADGLVARPVSPLAGWALRILCDIFDSGGPLVSDWHSSQRAGADEQHHPFARATDLLAALDQRRYELLPIAAPGRAARAAVAILPRHDVAGDVQYLFVYDAAADAWRLPGGRPNAGDTTTRDTLRRALVEGLGLTPGYLDQLTLIDLCPALLHTNEAPAHGPRSRTAFTPFLALGAQYLLGNGRTLRWLGEVALRAGQTEEGARIAGEPLLFLLDHPELELRALIESEYPTTRGA